MSSLKQELHDLIETLPEKDLESVHQLLTGPHGEEREALNRELEAGIAEVERGEVRDAREVLGEIRRRYE